MRLLLCEDEKELSDALVTILKHHNYSVDAVYDGQEALDYLETTQYDGVILDIMMPKVDGITVLKTLRNNNSSVPVLMLTAKSEIDDRVLGLDYGADDYVTKPFATKELLARIRSMTRRKNTIIKSELTLGNISLNCTTFELSSPKGTFRLANKEFQLMELFLANPKQIIPTERLLEKVWGYDTDTELNTVWVYISYLRKKLNALDATVQLKASRNLGYCLEVKT